MKSTKGQNEKGITLIALVITIVVLLILAGISISMLNGENGILTQAKQAKEKMEEEALKEEQQIENLESLINGTVVSNEGYDYTSNVNEPKLKSGMIPIRYNETNKEWEVADTSNAEKNWYDYEEKQWANICTVSNEKSAYRTAKVGTEIPIEEMTTMFVWIPRYAYSIENGYKTSNTTEPKDTNASGTKNIEIKFLVGNTNTDKDNKTYGTDYAEGDIKDNKTPMIVHPAFKIGNSQLTGIWVAKFEASGTNKDGNAVGNASSESSAQQYAPDEATYVKILPNVISWRHIEIGESQYQCIKMGTNTEAYGWGGVNTHLMRNSEWGAVAYLCYSKYGNVPMINGCGNYNSTSGYYYDLYTGMGPTSETSEGRYEATETSISDHAYNTAKGVLASTTGNVYGIYDMSGGAWERVAAYLDNGNGYLNTYGKSTSTNIKYFENGVLNSAYSSLWEGYKVSEEEKNNSIAVEGESSNLTQSQLWNKNGSTYTDTAINEKYNIARKRLTDATYNLLARVKGIGVNEVAGSHSYYGVNSAGNYTWLKNETDTSTNYGRAWNNDYVLIGHSSRPFVGRGGGVNGGTYAGVLYSIITYGYADTYYGFRVALCFGAL